MGPAQVESFKLHVTTARRSNLEVTRPSIHHASIDFRLFTDPRIYLTILLGREPFNARIRERLHNMGGCPAFHSFMIVSTCMGILTAAS